MGLAQAIKRSYPFLIPPSLLAPRTYVRRHIEPAFFYVIGLTTGMYTCAPPGEVKRISGIGSAVMLVLLVLKWWSARPAKSRRSRSQTL